MQTVRVLIANVYNGADHRSLGLCRKGQIIEVPDSYAESLLADGLVERYDSVPAVEPDPISDVPLPAPAPAPVKPAAAAPARGRPPAKKG